MVKRKIRRSIFIPKDKRKLRVDLVKTKDEALDILLGEIVSILLDMPEVPFKHFLQNKFYSYREAVAKLSRRTR